MKYIYALLAVLVVSSGAFTLFYFLTSTTDEMSFTTDTEVPVVIGLLMASNSTSIERWIKDRDFFTERAEELGAKVIVHDAETDSALQLRYAQDLIFQGVDVLVVVAQDAYDAATIVDQAHDAGIQVLAYDRLIKNPDLDYYVSFDSVKVGEAEAQGVVDVVNTGKFAYVGGSETDTNAFLVKEGAFKVLQPLIDNGQIELVYNEFTPDWRQEVAYTNMKNFLATGETVNAVVAANDSTATGVILALEEHGLAGKVPVSGQDASLTAVQALLTGKQTVTVYKPIKKLAYRSAEMAVALARDEEVETNGMMKNDDTYTPSYLLDVTPVTKDNIDETVIADKYLSREDVYGIK